MRLKAIELYRALWYEDRQDGGKRSLAPVWWARSPVTMAAAHACNTAKDGFKAAVLALKSVERAEVTAAIADLHRRQEQVAAAMRRMGAAAPEPQAGLPAYSTPRATSAQSRLYLV